MGPRLACRLLARCLFVVNIIFLILRVSVIH